MKHLEFFLRVLFFLTRPKEIVSRFRNEGILFCRKLRCFLYVLYPKAFSRG